ncbi:hypothetical protein PENSPDRAFT_654626 [Peniophora sp. CONT]|nr:hypothetical protein PENSPDRAFT_654626 [Peniophora sp. CONT]
MPSIRLTSNYTRTPSFHMHLYAVVSSSLMSHLQTWATAFSEPLGSRSTVFNAVEARSFLFHPLHQRQGCLGLRLGCYTSLKA